MAVSQGSSQALQVLNSLLVNQRQERRSDNELALTALSFNIKRDEAEKNRNVELLGIAQKERDSSIKALRDLQEKFAISGGTEKSLNEIQKKYGLQSDAYAVVGQYKMRIADEHKTVKESIGGLNQQIQGIEGAIDAYSAKIQEQGNALGVAAAKHFDTADVNKSGTISSEEFTAIFKDMGFSKDAEASVWKSFKAEEANRADLAYKKAYTGYRQASVGKGRASQKAIDRDRIDKMWLSINKSIEGSLKKDKLAILSGDLGVGGDPSKIKPETLYAAFVGKVRNFEDKYGDNILDQFPMQFAEDSEVFDEQFNKLMSILDPEKK